MQVESFDDHPKKWRKNYQQEQIVLERSPRLNLDPEKVDKGVGGDWGEIRDDQEEGGNRVTYAYSA